MCGGEREIDMQTEKKEKQKMPGNKPQRHGFR